MLMYDYHIINETIIINLLLKVYKSRDSLIGLYDLRFEKYITMQIH